MSLGFLSGLLFLPPNTPEASLSGSRARQGAEKSLEFVYAASLLVRMPFQVHFLHLLQDFT